MPPPFEDSLICSALVPKRHDPSLVLLPTTTCVDHGPHFGTTASRRAPSKIFEALAHSKGHDYGDAHPLVGGRLHHGLRFGDHLDEHERKLEGQAGKGERVIQKGVREQGL